MNWTAFQLRKKKKMLWSKYRLTLDAMDHARFARCKNQLRKLTRNLRQEYESRLAADLKNNPKAFWCYTSSRLKTKCRVEDLRDEGGTLMTDDQTKSEVLSRYFSSVFTVEGEAAPPLVDFNFVGPELDDIDVSPQKVKAKLISLRPASSPGPDAIHPRLLHSSAEALSVPLSILFRKSVDSGRLPADWKSGEVVPIYKKGDRQLPSSYRPISLTAVLRRCLRPSSVTTSCNTCRTPEFSTVLSMGSSLRDPAPPN